MPVQRQAQPNATYVIAIDGPAAAGKGTVAKLLASDLGLAYLDSGKIYRTIALRADAAGVEPDDDVGMRRIAAELHYSDFAGLENLSGKAGRLAAKFAAYPNVRTDAVEIQRRVAAEELTSRPGIVIDGRDIGTVVFPDAFVKLYVTASPEARAKRRHSELVARGEEVTLEQVLQDLNERDHRDSARATAPLIQAADAVLLDTTEMTIDDAADAARRIVEAARARWEQSRSG